MVLLLAGEGKERVEVAYREPRLRKPQWLDLRRPKLVLKKDLSASVSTTRVAFVCLARGSALTKRLE
jgi:hypothetical protein